MLKLAYFRIQGWKCVKKIYLKSRKVDNTTTTVTYF